MALIEILIHYHFFDWVRLQLLRLHLNDKAQFALMIGITFMLSGVLDNISLTIAMIQVSRRFFSGKNLLLAACAVIIASLGLLSGIVDNLALMAISLQVFPITDPELWGLIAITTAPAAH